MARLIHDAVGVDVGGAATPALPRRPKLRQRRLHPFREGHFGRLLLLKVEVGHFDAQTGYDTNSRMLSNVSMKIRSTILHDYEIKEQFGVLFL